MLRVCSNPFWTRWQCFTMKCPFRNDSRDDVMALRRTGILPTVRQVRQRWPTMPHAGVWPALKKRGDCVEQEVISGIGVWHLAEAPS